MAPLESPRFNERLTVGDDGWMLVETGWEADRSVAVGSNFMVGNGKLGYRATTPDQGPDGFVALVVTDTYDCADGRWRELTTAPNPLFVALAVEGRKLSIDTAENVAMTLDLRRGRHVQRVAHRVDDATVTVDVERFVAFDRLEVLAQRVVFTTDRDLTATVTVGIDDNIWSLNGTHLPEMTFERQGPITIASGTTAESAIDIAVAARVGIGDRVEAALAGERGLDTHRVSLMADTPLAIETVAAVATSSDHVAVTATAAEQVAAAVSSGYDRLLEESAAAWDAFWRNHDIRIEGAPLDDAAVRFAVYHNRICTPAHTDHLPIGARGLSCQAYQGAAFWDQEVYNLPAFLFTAPEIARSILVYRHRTLDGARRKARRLGYDGAYFAWISGTTGDELCPDVFFRDVLTGREIRNHFNVWQMHVAPDIVTTIRRYVDVTGDTRFLVDHGAEIAFEVARFLRSFVRWNDWREIYHCIRLLGPDEWHENVDDNAFTNYQTHTALAYAIELYETLGTTHPDGLASLVDRLGLSEHEVERWRHVRDHLLLPEPDRQTRLIEQFTGFFDLEDITPDALRERLLDPAEYWGWPNGVAVRTQVSKQADVPMLLWLQAERFADDVVRANYDYYEPRCSHNSSLSHAAFGMVAARLGDADVALGHLRATARVDLLNTNHAIVAGTFIGGIHTAACGGTIQLAVEGLGGLRFIDDSIVIIPSLPSEWEAIEYPLQWRHRRLRVRVTHGGVTITGDAGNEAPVELRVRDERISVDPGQSVSC